MKMKNNYKELLGILDFFHDGRENTKEESELIRELSQVLDTNKKNKMMAQIFYQDEGVLGLLKKINQSISKYQETLKKYELKENTLLDFDGARKRELESKIRSLMELKRKILSHVDTNVDYHTLVIKCAGALATGSFSLPKYYGKSLVTRDYRGFKINKDIVRRVYDFLTNEQQVAKLEHGVHIMQDINDATQKVTACDEALRYKAAVYCNQNDIFEYNRIKKQLIEVNSKIGDYDRQGDFEKELRTVDRKINSLRSNKVKRLIHSCAISELEDERPYLVGMIENRKNCIELRDRLIGELSIVKKRLSKSILGEVIMRVETDELFYNRNCQSPKNSLANKFSSFQRVEDIDAYYQSIKIIRDEANEKLQESMKQKESLDLCTVGQVKTLLNCDLETAVNILDLRDAKERNGITPVVALYALEMIVSMESTDLSDMDVTSDDLERARDSVKTSIGMIVGRYTDEYLDIIQTKKGKTYKK